MFALPAWFLARRQAKALGRLAEPIDGRHRKAAPAAFQFGTSMFADLGGNLLGF
ncbi:hypothetical protein IE4803_PD00198 (plasmid) [Rhizobium etli bv. phaseoli str. IE4803]|nr:hypothetical protein IE4803_PD00198 [Rhizobium etli bv. phaseoli str. IE4803]